MPKTLQIRDVPDELHRRLKAGAAMAGLSLSDFVLLRLEETLGRPGRREVLERIATRSGVTPDVSPAEVIRRERGSR